MTDPTYKEIANSYKLWGEYVDPDRHDSLAWFEQTNEECKINMQIKMFGEEDEEDLY